MPPLIPAGAALLLDIDGTLLDIAPRPDAVVVPAALAQSLVSLRRALGGAVGAISGRTMAEIDALLGQPGLPCAAEHGALVRLPDGTIEASPHRLEHRDAWAEALRRDTAAWPGIIIEAKTYSLVAHYRLAPDRETALQMYVERLVQTDPAAEILPARMAFEIRPHGFGKGGALRRLMREPPFAGRAPVFVGDDTTDEPAIAAAAQLGGSGLHVARDFAGAPEAVRAWLAASAAALGA